eukprot:m51a1_g14275 hypothetical protein (71) ;mRNA; r:352169-352381
MPEGARQGLALAEIDGLLWAFGGVPDGSGFQAPDEMRCERFHPDTGEWDSCTGCFSSTPCGRSYFGLAWL